MENEIIQEDLAFIAKEELQWGQLSGKTVLITGANGFLPSYMVKTLIYLNVHRNLDIRIIGLVRNKKNAMERFGSHIDKGDMELIVQNVCDPIEFDSDIDYIVHAASQASPKYYGKDPVGTLAPNVLGTANMLNLAVKKRVKGFLFFSSGEIYGHVDPSQIPLKENFYGCIDPLDVRSCYAEGKKMGETMCISWLHQYGVLVKIARIFHTYGPGMKVDDGRVFADFVFDVVNGRDILMHSDGSAVRSFCYISDSITALFTVLLKGEIGQAYNVGNDEAEISIIDLANLLVALYPEKGLSVVRQEQKTKTDYLKSPFNRQMPEIEKIKELGWIPRINLNEGFKRTIESFS